VHAGPAITIDTLTATIKTGYRNFAQQLNETSLGSVELFYPQQIEDIMAVIKIPCDWQGSRG
jgi:hypothetical protein